MISFRAAFMRCSFVTSSIYKLTSRSYCDDVIPSPHSRCRPVETAIHSKLTQHLAPTFLQVINESHMHCVDEDAETHFKVVIVSKKFENESLIKCHKLVNNILQHELRSGLHALSVTVRTPAEWESGNKTISSSPSCRGGASF
jgi:BolA protein